MAIIKCPECGHQVSDKAPVCPSCGVQIAGKIIRCPNCGEIYFKSEEVCPNCHRPTTLPLQDRVAQTPPATPPATAAPQQHSTSTATVQPQPQPDRNTPEEDTPEATPQKPKKKSHSAIWVGLVIALLICTVCFYFYHEASSNKEREAYENAISSNDPLIMQQYLNDYGEDADSEHVQYIKDLLAKLKQNDIDWQNAIMSQSKAALEEYLQKHPDSPHRRDAYNRIDSLDWLEARNENTVEAYQSYLNEHEDGAHIDEANDAIKKVKAKEVQPEEKEMISGLFRSFFQSVNSRNEGGLTAACEDILSSFLGKSDATKEDVRVFLQKIYKDDITNMNWRLNNDYNIKKHEVGEESFEYQVNFTARQDVEHTDANKNGTNRYKITATVSPNHKISALNMVRIKEVVE